MHNGTKIRRYSTKREGNPPGSAEKFGGEHHSGPRRVIHPVVLLRSAAWVYATDYRGVRPKGE
ncbi:hypothetical protein GCM10011588_53050 [Nocardia jinanensis]|uniref:Uncharacterized protein n=1 Tax=Nocardia jinanensis TaxID=382504 RepID=A0A917RUT8_9NOCA|nr:hypothetical protein GCM10011588_53050 [Nocardia jinanensis]